MNKVPAQRLWQTAEYDETIAAEIAGKLGVPRPLAAAMASRGFTSAPEAESFLSPRLSTLSDPLSLPGVPCAIERISAALRGGERIAVYGDYDVDGVAGTALLTTVLRHLGGQVTPFLPRRLEEGYGLTPAALGRCLRENAPSLVVTVDCGTSATEALEMAARAGVDVVVTDHHEATGSTAPVRSLINPTLGDDEGTAHLAGVGVVFKLCHGLLKERTALVGRAQEPDLDLRHWLDVVALGTVADVVPLLGENRTMVRHGLDRFSQTTSVGLRALMNSTRMNGPVDCYDLGFVLGPRINAAGRMGSADSALELLLTSDPARARRLAGILDSANRDRRLVEEGINQEAVAELDGTFDEQNDFGLVVARSGWHPGTVGIVAGRLCRRYQRPAVVIALDQAGTGRGSCRSMHEVDLIDVLRECSKHLVSFGGHRMAAGLVVKAASVPEFRNAFRDACRRRLHGRDLRPAQRVDAWVRLDELDDNLYEGVRSLRPMGLGNPTPIWGVENVRVIGQPRVVGNGHVKMTVACGNTRIDGIAFGMAGRTVPTGTMSLLFQLQENTYLARRTLQLNIKDWCSDGMGSDGVARRSPAMVPDEPSTGG
jgi:single-stranded-DNA-specific exonuclease